MKKDYFKDWCKHNPYIPIYNPMTNTYCKGTCKEIKGDAKYRDGYKII